MTATASDVVARSESVCNIRRSHCRACSCGGRSAPADMRAKIVVTSTTPNVAKNTHAIDSTRFFHHGRRGALNVTSRASMKP